MNLFLTHGLPALLGSLAPDDNTVAALAVLIGAIGGWQLANLSGQLKAKRAKVRKPPTRRIDE